MNTENNLARLRKHKGLSQWDVAEALDVSRQAVSRWEIGTAAPSTDNLIRLSRLYEVTLDELIRGEAPPQPEAAPPQTAEETPPARETAGKRRVLRAAIAGLAVLLCLLAVILAYRFGVSQGEKPEIIAIRDLEGEVLPSAPEVTFELYPY